MDERDEQLSNEGTEASPYGVRHHLITLTPLSLACLGMKHSFHRYGVLRINPSIHLSINPSTHFNNSIIRPFSPSSQRYRRSETCTPRLWMPIPMSSMISGNTPQVRLATAIY